MLQTETHKLQAVSPFDFSKTLEALWFFDKLLGDPLSPSSKLVKAVNIGTKTVGFQLRAVGFIDSPQIEYQLYCSEPYDNSLIEVFEHRLNLYLGLQEDLTPFYQLATRDEAFSTLLHRFYGYHPIRFLTPFEAVCWAILTQRCLLPLAQKKRQAIIAAYEQAVQVEEMTCYAFPLPEKIVTEPLEKLVACIQDEKKAEYIYKAAKAFLHVEESWLLNAEFHQVENWLYQLEGIGFSSALMVLLQGLGRSEQAPLTDKKLLSAVKKIYGKEKSRTDIPKLAEFYGKWQGYWALYLIHACDN